MNMLLDEVPTCVDLFTMLWKSKAKVLIPDTIVYRYGLLESWFYVSSVKSPVVMKKRQFTMRHGGMLEKIETALSVGSTKDDDIVAVWVAGEPGQPSTVLHLTKYSLHQFLTNVPGKGHGVLQSFIRPFGEHNAVLRTQRTPHHR